MFKKIRKIRITEWQYLTLGEKILEIVLGLLKWGLIITVGLTVGAMVLAFVVGGYLAFAVVGAIADGLHNASLGYEGDGYYGYDDYYRRFR